MVDALPRLEVGAKATANARCDAAVAQQSTAQYREVASADHSSVRLARHIQGRRIQGQRRVDELADSQNRAAGMPSLSASPAE